MKQPKKLTRNQIAWRVAQDLKDGDYVNLGVGLPLLVANFIPDGRDVILHAENGVLAFGEAPPKGQEDFRLINAGTRPVTLRPGGAFFHHADSFLMIRGGHLDACVLGAYQVSTHGDISNWNLDDPNSRWAPAVGGAMDLVYGSPQVFVIMEHNAKDGTPKIVEKCTLPLTGVGCVSRIYTDLAVLSVTDDGLVVREIVDGLSFDELQERTGTHLIHAADCSVIKAPSLPDDK